MNGALTLNGAFKVDVYGRDGVMKYSTDYFNNFITPTGLSFPFQLSFADCFKTLSLGSGTANNTVVGVGTTGLQTPIPQFSYIKTLFDDNCGTTESASGTSLNRAWRVPEEEGTYFTGAFSFQEFMVNPKAPADIDPYKDAYDYRKAFSRVVKNVNVLDGDYAIVNYKLDINNYTGTKTFAMIVDGTRVRTNGNSTACTGWGNASGFYSLVHNGIKVIGSTDSAWEGQPGVTLEPKMGYPMEPSCPEENLKFYLSRDNSQFLFNEDVGGACVTGERQPWNVTGKAIPNGLCYYHPGLETRLRNGIPPVYSTVLDKIRYESFKAPSESDARNEEDVTLNVISPSSLSITKSNLPSSGRSRAVIRTVTWNSQVNEAASVGGYDEVRSVVCAFKPTEGEQYWPFFDGLFCKYDAYQCVPAYNTGSSSGVPPPTYSKTSGAGSYLFVDGNNILTLGFKLSWSSPCGGALGC